MSMMFWTIFSIITLTILTVVTAWVIMKIIYKHRVRVIDLGKQSIELDYKARDYFKDGVRYWRLDKERHKELKLMPLPPADAINLAKRGKKSVTVWRTETGEYIYALRKELLSQEELNNELNNIPEKIKQVIDEKKRKELVI